MTQSNPGATKSHTNNFWKVVAKWIVTPVLIAGITSYIKGGVKPHMTSPIASTVTFSGRVTDNAGKTIQGATVIASIDQEVPEASQSDSNGVFQFQLPAAAQSLRLSVSADGYKPMETEAQIHRTGPQAIIMQPLGASPVAEKPRRHAAIQTPAPPTQPSSIQAPASQPVPAINYAPGGFATSGGTLINPQITTIVQDTGRLLSPTKYQLLIDGIRSLKVGTAALILHQPVDKEMNRFGGELQAAFHQAGWNLIGFPPRDLSHNHVWVNFGTAQQISNVSEGLHCVSDGSELAQNVVNALSAVGVMCEMSSSMIYPTPMPQPALTLFMGRNLD
jgi:hypothetical protein